MPEEGCELALALAWRQAVAGRQGGARLGRHRDDDRSRWILHVGQRSPVSCAAVHHPSSRMSASTGPVVLRTQRAEQKEGKHLQGGMTQPWAIEMNVAHVTTRHLALTAMQSFRATQ